MYTVHTTFCIPGILNEIKMDTSLPNFSFEAISLSKMPFARPKTNTIGIGAIGADSPMSVRASYFDERSLSFNPYLSAVLLGQFLQQYEYLRSGVAARDLRQSTS